MIEMPADTWYKHYMDERETQILQVYQEFNDRGIVDTPATDLDAETAHDILAKRVNEFEHDIDVVYEKNKSQATSSLTKAALLRLMIEGGTDDDLREFVAEYGLSQRTPIAVRREDAIKAIDIVRKKAEKTQHLTERMNELQLREADYRSLDDTLSTLLERGELGEMDQGSMRLLFGLVNVDDPRFSFDVVMHLKSNAAARLRHKLVVADTEQRFASSLRAKEGKALLYRLVTRTRTGYPTVQSVAETIAFDKENHIEAVYTNNIERNQMMIETFVSSALDVMYPNES